MTTDEYLNERLKDQIDWYDRKSQFNQKKFKQLRRIEIIAAAFIPFLSGTTVAFECLSFWGPIIIGGLGLIITIVSSIISLSQYQEHWVDYRTICETLRKEKYLFEMQVEPYHQKDRDKVLVLRVESIISKENTQWMNLKQQLPEEEDHKKS